MNKYNAKKTMIDGIRFDSKAEAKRYEVLSELEQNGEIECLVLQPEFVLQPHYKSPLDGHTVRAVKYRADFLYTKDGETVVEDVKGVRTPVYKLKKKLFEYKYGIAIKETK